MINRSLHCIAKYENGYWSARCLDFTIYAVGESLAEAKAKLYVQIEEYIYDALIGEDKDYAVELFLRKAPLKDWIEWYWISFFTKCNIFKKWAGEAFEHTIPHAPYHHV